MSSTPNPIPEPLPAPTPAPKPGFQTSEFWVSLAAMGSIVASQFTGHDPNTLATAATAATAAVYTIVRMFVKFK